MVAFRDGEHRRTSAMLTQRRRQCLIAFGVALVFLITASLASAVNVVNAAPPKAEPKDDFLGAPAPKGAVVLLSADMKVPFEKQWVHRDGKPASWPVHDGILTVKPKSGDIHTVEKFKDFQLHVEFQTPYMPKAKGQARGNSGVYLQGLYELQVLDSYGLDLQDNDCGAIYKQIVPAVNACKPPLQWQSYEITFRAAEVKDGKIVKKAKLTVIQNGHIIIKNAEIDVTPGGVAGAAADAPGPILLQDHGNPVEYRNIWIKTLED